MSEDILKKITLEINKHESLEDKELNIIRFQLLKKSNILKVILRGKERLAIEEEELIKKIICKTLMIRITIEILFYKDASNISLEEVVESHWLECISDTIKKTPLCKTLLLSSKRVVEGNKVIVLNGYDKVTEHLKSKYGDKSIEGTIEAIFGLKCKVEIRFDPSMEVIIDYAEKEKNERALLEKLSNRVHTCTLLANASKFENISYIQETKKYMVPMCKNGMLYYPQYANQIEIMQSHIMAISNVVEVLTKKRNW